MLYEYKGIRPRIGRNVFIAPGAIVLGDVEIGEGSNLWFYTVARGDVHFIKIGSMTNIQDHCTLHVTGGRHPLVIGDRVIIGHRAVLHGCTIMDGALVGIGALVLDAAVVEEGATVAAGAVVAPGTVIPAGRVAVGVPARPIRDVTEEEKSYQGLNYRHYHEYARLFDEFVRPIDD
ncbi:MAG: gamma carbonic anhydrase family protein [Desulfomonile sp.]|nr:gamma carbonic anhydrase family protein [Desulfomonile sp.]